MIVWLFANWDWLGALVAGPAAVIVRRIGPRWAVWALLVLAVLLALRAVHGGYRDIVARERAAERAACDAGWREKLAEAEQAARDTIRRREDAAWRAGVAAEAARRAADAADAAEAETIIREIIHASESAASCRYDEPSVRALNRLRGGG